MSKKLYITEKSTQVTALKKVIKDGSLFEPLAGHIMRPYRPEEYDERLDIKSWHKNVIEDNYPIFPEKIKKKVQEAKKNGKFKTNYKEKFDKIRDAIKKCDEIVIASDPDNEGVVLAYEVIEALGATNKIVGMINMAKLDPISLAKEVKVMNKIPYEKMNHAGNLRSEFDWLFGMNLSPIATIHLGQGQTLHMGGVKLPTIRMVVERDIAYEKFKEIPFWEATGQVRDPKSGKEFDVKIKFDGEDRFSSEESAKNALSTLPKETLVTEYKEDSKKTAPPKPYSLTDLQAEAGRIYKFTPKKTLEIAQKLYEKGIQSYPRTEENYYADGQYIETKAIISNLKSIPEFSKFDIKEPFMKRPIFNDKKLEGKAHTALAPTPSFVNTLTPDETKIYMLVAKRYFIQFMEDYKYLGIKIASKKLNYELIASENVQQSLGWKAIGVKDDNSKERFLPKMTKGDTLEILGTELKKGFTKPKPRFTEATLLKGMERISTIYDDATVKEHLGESGIGTPATRATIIEDLINKGYIEIGKSGKDKGKVISTEKARYFMETLPENITSPVLRAELESELKDIVFKDKNPTSVRKHIQKTIDQFIGDIKVRAKDKGIKIQSSGGNGKPSSKQVDFAKSIEENIKKDGQEPTEKLTEDILGNRGELSKWIDVNKELGGFNGKKRTPTLSPKQIEWIKKMIDNKSKEKVTGRSSAIKAMDKLDKGGELNEKEFKATKNFLDKCFSNKGKTRGR